MPSTITIQQTLNWIAAYIVQRPTTGVAGIANEPGLTAANLIGQTILQPPFRWSWNRAESSAITTTAGTSDYATALASWGWLERATGFLSTNDPPTFELEVAQVMPKDTRQNRPRYIMPILDDNAGNITFRLVPTPDAAYAINLTYQKVWPLATGLGAATWSPIPDRYAFLYERGLLAHMQGMYSAQLYAINIELFWRQLVGAAEGLTETEKAIFLEDKLRQFRTQQAGTMSVPQGRQART